MFLGQIFVIFALFRRNNPRAIIKRTLQLSMKYTLAATKKCVVAATGSDKKWAEAHENGIRGVLGVVEHESDGQNELKKMAAPKWPIRVGGN